MNQKKTSVIVGGGAAGFFAAIRVAELHPDSSVIILEKSSKLLSKVKVSGGGRCNVTNACFDIPQLSKNYPRGEKQLLQAFHQFNTMHTVDWFESRGVKLKAEADGRMFPESNSSQSIIDCLMQTAQQLGVKINLNSKITAIEKNANGFELKLESLPSISCNTLIIAAGGSSKLDDYTWIKNLGHSIVQPLPSLFTFNVPKNSITELMGVSVANCKVAVSGTKLNEQGPVLITHWGFSGPAILKLSAWGARILNEKNYRFEFRINWLPQFNFESIQLEFQKVKIAQAKQQLSSRPWNEIPKRLWEFFLAKAEIKENLKWADVSKKQVNKLSELLCNTSLQAEGKTTFKEEFVTCGGIDLEEVDFKTMQSKKCEHLFFAGEILNIDGVTGGFNFQAAWTTAWIAGSNA